MRLGPTSTRISEHGRLLAAVFLGVVIMSGTGGCSLFSQDDHPVVYIQNATSQKVDVVLVGDAGGEAVVTTGLAPGAATSYDRLATTTCTAGVLVARGQDGKEVDRSVGPVCRPSQWVIDGVLPTPSP